jgi:hypothetical protein
MFNFLGKVLMIIGAATVVGTIIQVKQLHDALEADKCSKEIK